MTFDSFLALFIGSLFTIVGALLVISFRAATLSITKSMAEMQESVKEMGRSVDKLNVTVTVEMTKSEALKKELDKALSLLGDLLKRVEVIELNQAANNCGKRRME